MKVLVGLGNPGTRFDNTRHNVGFMAMDVIARQIKVPINREKYDGFIGEGSWRGEKVLLLKPMTFMNRSGLSLAKALRNANCETGDVLVLTDDVNLPLGKLRLRISGSAGGHNGLKSIIESLGTLDFPRLRMGVGESVSAAVLSDHVLGKFRPDERDAVDTMIERAAQAALAFVTDGIERAMNTFN